MAKGITYQELTQLVAQLSQKKRTGTLFLRTGDNHSGMIFFSAGAVIGVTCGTFRGRAAIAALKEVSSFSFRFEEGRPPPVRQDLLSPEETLADFGIGAGGSTPSVGAASRPAASPPPATAPARPHVTAAAATPDSLTETLVSFDLSLERLVRVIFTEEMTEHLGPAGFTMVEDAEATTGGLGTREQVETALRHLAGELADTGEQEEFVKDVEERIGSLFTKEACALITGELNEYVGPVAANICSEAIQQQGGHIASPRELERLILQLSKEIEDPREAVSFQLKVHEALSKLTLADHQ